MQRPYKTRPECFSPSGRLFGKGKAATANDLGLRGADPKTGDLRVTEFRHNYFVHGRPSWNNSDSNSEFTNVRLPWTNDGALAHYGPVDASYKIRFLISQVKAFANLPFQWNREESAYCFTPSGNQLTFGRIWTYGLLGLNHRERAYSPESDKPSAGDVLLWEDAEFREGEKLTFIRAYVFNGKFWQYVFLPTYEEGIAFFRRASGRSTTTTELLALLENKLQGLTLKPVGSIYQFEISESLQREMDIAKEEKRKRDARNARAYPPIKLTGGVRVAGNRTEGYRGQIFDKNKLRSLPDGTVVVMVPDVVPKRKQYLNKGIVIAYVVFRAKKHRLACRGLACGNATFNVDDREDRAQVIESVRNTFLGLQGFTVEWGDYGYRVVPKSASTVLSDPSSSAKHITKTTAGAETASTPATVLPEPAPMPSIAEAVEFALLPPTGKVTSHSRAKQVKSTRNSRRDNDRQLRLVS